MNNISIDKNKILFFADGFRCKDEAADFLDERIEHIESFGKDIELCRLIFITDPESLNIMNLGNHWVEDEDVLDDIEDYLKNECAGEEIEGDSYLIRASFKASDINIETTLTQNVLNPEEQEIYIDSNTRPLSGATIETFNRPGVAVSLREFIGNREEDLSYEC